MINGLRAKVLALLVCAAVPFAALAGMDEGLAAYDKKDYATALREFTPLAQQGNAKLQLVLGVMHDVGRGIQQNYKEAIKWYRLAAEQGEAGAYFALGVKYQDGQGVPQDYEEALKWYRLAADQGNIDAQYNLGGMYAKGQGLPQNYEEAVKWYRLAANQGYTKAQTDLGTSFEYGEGVPQDYKEAVKWYRLAADQGNAGAQNNLGVKYEYGMGVAASRVVAYAFYNLSAANDPSADNKATANRASLAENMSNREIAVAQDLTRELAKPKNLLMALDKYVKKPTVKEAKPVVAREDVDEPVERGASAPSDEFPAPPAKRSGVVSCNTRCVNAACWRTYDDGRKVRFQAQPVVDPFTNALKFDSGNC